MAVAQNEVSTVFTSNVSGLQQGLATASKGVEGFGSIGTAAFKQLGIAAAALAISFGFKEALDAFSKFESGLNGVRQELGKVREGELKGFEQGLKDLAVGTGASLNELTKGLKNVVNSGLDAGNELSALSKANQLAAISGISLKSSIDAIDIVTKQFGKSAGDTTLIADKLFETARQGKAEVDELGTFLKRVGTVASGSKVSFDELAGTLAYLTAQGVPFRQGQSAIIEGLHVLNTLTPEQTAVYAAHGIQLDKNSIANEGFANSLKKLIAIGEGSATSLGIQSTSYAILSKVGTNANEVIAKTAEISKSSGAVSREFGVQQQTTAAQMDKVKQSMAVLMVEAITPFIPLLKEVVVGIQVVVKGFQDFVIANGPAIRGLIELATSGIAPLLPFLAQLALFIGYAISNLLALIEPLAKVRGAIGGGLVDALKTALEWWEKIIPPIKTVIDWIEKVTKTAFDWQKEQYDARVASEEHAKAIRTVADELVKTAEATKNAAGATQDANKQTTTQVALTTQLTEAQKKDIIALDQKTLKQRQEDTVIASLIIKYAALLKSYQDGTIKSDEFRKQLEGLVASGKLAGASIDAIVSAFQAFNATDHTIDLKVRLEADTAILDLKERVLQAQEDLTTNSLQGEDRKRREIEITEARYIRAIEAEMHADLIKFNEEIHQIEAARLAEIAKITQNSALKDSERAAAIAKANEDANAQTNVAKGVIDFEIAQLKLLEDVKKAATIQALKDAGLELDSTQQLIDKNNQLIQVINQRNRTVQGGQGSTINFGEFSPGATTTVLGGIGGATIQTLSGFTKTSQQVAAATKQVAASAALTAGAVYNLPRVLVSGPGQAPTPNPGVFTAFAEGTGYVPNTGLALLHKGEAVLSAEENRIRGKAGGAQTTIVNLIDPAMVPAILAKYPNAVLNIVNADILRNGPTRRVIKATT